MANQIPFSGASQAAGGYILPFDQGTILTEGLLRESGALALAGDSRATSTRREVFSIWKGTPTAAFVGEAGTKPVTGGEFGPGTLNIKKVAVIVTFTDEMLEDVQAGDLNVLVDGGIRSAIADTIDNDAVKGSQFDTQLNDTATSVAVSGSGPDALAKAVSAAMGTLEQNGYGDSPMAALLPSDMRQYLRDQRVVPGGGTAGTVASSLSQFTPMNDPLYGIERHFSTNLDRISAGGTIGYVVAKNNLHVRVRKDVTVFPSREAVVGGTSLYEQDLTAARYVTRLGLFIHDIDRAVVKITK